MSGRLDILDRAIPDTLSTDALSPALSAEVDHLAGRTEPWTRSDPDVQWGLRCRALVAAGSFEAARQELVERTSTGEVETTVQGLAAAVWAAARVGPPPVIEALQRQVDRLDDGFLLQDDVPLGSTEQLRGLLRAARSDLPGATADLGDAASIGDRRAPLWGALARLELGRVLRSSGADHAASTRALTSARTFFAAGGYRHLAAVARLTAAPPIVGPGAVPGLGHLVAGPRWMVGFGVAPPVEVRPAKGLTAIAHLVVNRDRQVPAVELDRLLAGRPMSALAPKLDAALSVAQGPDDLRLCAELRAQFMDDRARSRVSKLLHRTTEKLGEAHPLLGEHLAASIQTGYACRYHAPGGVLWRLSISV